MSLFHYLLFPLSSLSFNLTPRLRHLHQSIDQFNSTLFSLQHYITLIVLTSSHIIFAPLQIVSCTPLQLSSSLFSYITHSALSRSHINAHNNTIVIYIARVTSTFSYCPSSFPFFYDSRLRMAHTLFSSSFHFLRPSHTFAHTLFPLHFHFLQSPKRIAHTLIRIDSHHNCPAHTTSFLSPLPTITTPYNRPHIRSIVFTLLPFCHS